MKVSSAEVMLHIIDANDHYPEFSQSNYIVSVLENTDLNTRIADITASDSDSGVFSHITYSIGGFGMEKFGTDSTLGGLILIGRMCRVLGDVIRFYSCKCNYSTFFNV